MSKNIKLPDWFDLKKYEDFNVCSDLQFAYNLFIRRYLLGCLSLGEELPEVLTEEMFSLIESIKSGLVTNDKVDFSDLLNHSVLGSDESVGRGVVATLPIQTAHKIYEAVKADTILRGEIARYEYKSDNFDTFDDSWFEDVYRVQSIMCLIENTASDYSDFFNIIEIDLNASDEDILLGVKDWLRLARISKDHSHIKESEIEDVSNNYEKLREKVIKFKVLPYLDLKIFSFLEKTTYTYNILGNAIFPEVYDVDTTEVVRKTTKPLAHKALNISQIFYRNEYAKALQEE